MNDFTTDAKMALTNKISLTEIVHQHVEDAVNQLLENELTVFLDHEKWDIVAKNTDDCRNGYYECTINSEYGPLHLRGPRDLTGDFEPHTVRKRAHSTDGLEQTIIQLYQEGITTREISEKWAPTYPQLKKVFERRDNRFSFLAFLESVRRSLYTNNLAESLNKGLKRMIKVKEQFPTEDTLERGVC